MKMNRKRNKSTGTKTRKRKRLNQNDDSDDDVTIVGSSSGDGSRGRPFRAVRNKIQSYCEILENDLERSETTRDKFDVEKRLANLTMPDLNRIVLTRDDVEKCVKLPNFKRTMPGFFVRIQRVVGVYEAYQIREVVDGQSLYRVGKVDTSFLFRTKSGRQQKKFELNSISNNKLTEKDFESWASRIRTEYQSGKVAKLCKDDVIPSKEFIEMKERDILQMHFESDQKFKSFDQENLFKKRYFEKLDLSERNIMKECTNQDDSTVQAKVTESCETEVAMSVWPESTDIIEYGLGEHVPIRTELALPLGPDCKDILEDAGGNHVPQFRETEVTQPVWPVDIKEDMKDEHAPKKGSAILGTVIDKRQPGMNSHVYVGMEIKPDVCSEWEVVPSSHDSGSTTENCLNVIPEVEDMEDLEEEPDLLSLQGHQKNTRLLDDPEEIIFRLLQKRDAVVRYLNRMRKTLAGHEY